MMKRNSFFGLLLTVLLLGTSFMASAVDSPEPGDGKWYYVKSQRSNTAGYFWTFDGKDIYPQPLTKGNNQKFTLVETQDGLVSIKTQDGLFLNDLNRDLADNSALPSFDTNGVSVGFTLVENYVDGVKGFAFEGGANEGGLHQGGTSWQWRVGSSAWYDLSDYCTFFFYEAKENIDLTLKIEEATILVENTYPGTTPGSTPESAFDALTGAIKVAEVRLQETDPTVLSNAVAELQAAITTFKTSKIDLVQSSTEASPRWYLIKNTLRTGGKGATLYVNDLEGGVSITSAANQIPADGSGSGETEAELKHLFRFEKDQTGNYRIVNALFPEGELLQASGTSEPVKYGMPTSPNTVWDLKYVDFDGDHYQFNMISGGTVAHASGSLTVVQWNAADQMVLNANSTWYAEEFSGPLSVTEVKDVFRPIVVNNAIAAGDRKVEVFTLVGVMVENKNLKRGVYVAKVAGKAYKVTVK